MKNLKMQSIKYSLGLVNTAKMLFFNKRMACNEIIAITQVLENFVKQVQGYI